MKLSRAASLSHNSALNSTKVWLRDIAADEIMEASHPLLGFPNHAIMTDDGIIGFFGIVRIWNGVAEVWFKPSLLTRLYTKTLLRWFPGEMETIMQEMELHRAYCLARPEHLRFAVLAGFHPECRLRGHAPDGSDYYICDFVGVK